MRRALLLGLGLLLAPAARAAVKAVPLEPVRSIAVGRGDYYLINRRPAPYLGSGDYKEVLMHPDSADHVVKVFYGKNGQSVPEQRRELRKIRLLAPLGLTPPVVEQGAVKLQKKPTGYVVAERVHGNTLEKP